MKSKNLLTLTITACFMLLITIASSCKKDDNTNTNPVNTPAVVTSIVTAGNWRLTYYFDTNTDKTASFSGYTFTFNTNNTLSATNGSNTYLGIWNVTETDTDNDSIDDLHFNISFSSPVQFADLTEDWKIIEKSATILKLRHVSGGNGGTDLLTFTKN